MPRKNETDLSHYDLARATRGKCLEKAQRSLGPLAIDKKSPPRPVTPKPTRRSDKRSRTP